jgi:hypothetical protein
VAVCVFLIIYLTSWYTIDWREEETSYPMVILTSQITQQQTAGIWAFPSGFPIPSKDCPEAIQ